MLLSLEVCGWKLWAQAAVAGRCGVTGSHSLAPASSQREGRDEGTGREEAMRKEKVRKAQVDRAEGAEQGQREGRRRRGREAAVQEALQAELRSAALGWALREVSSDSFFSRFFSSSGNFS